MKLLEEKVWKTDKISMSWFQMQEADKAKPTALLSMQPSHHSAEYSESLHP